MNRRELLLLAAAAACGTAQQPRRAPREDARKDAGVHGPGAAIVDDWSADTRKGSQLRPSPPGAQTGLLLAR